MEQELESKNFEQVYQEANKNGWEMPQQAYESELTLVEDTGGTSVRLNRNFIEGRSNMLSSKLLTMIRKVLSLMGQDEASIEESIKKYYSKEDSDSEEVDAEGNYAGSNPYGVEKFYMPIKSVNEREILHEKVIPHFKKSGFSR